MLFLTAIYEEMSLSYSVLGLTEKECRAVMNEKIAAAALLWDEENYDEEGEFLTYGVRVSETFSGVGMAETGL